MLFRSNQGLCALRSIIHMSLLGPVGLCHTAENSMTNARYAVEKLTAINGVELLNNAPYGNEFALKLPCSAHDITAKMTANGIIPGFPVGQYYKDMDNVLLVACTEKTTIAQINDLASMLGGLL